MYNKWYLDTYDVIFKMADWSRFDAEIPRKVICIFAWMPQTIMGLKDKGGKKLWESVSEEKMHSLISGLTLSFEITKSETFLSYGTVTEQIKKLYYGLSTGLRSTATTKYLHFSHPNLFPMWDSEIKKQLNLKDSPEDYVKLIEIYNSKYSDQNLRGEILKEYPPNFVRAYDIYLMKNRNA